MWKTQQRLAVQGIEQRLAVCTFQQGLDVQGIEEAGTRLAQGLTKKESIAKMKASMAPEVLPTRVPGVLCLPAGSPRLALSPWG